MSPTSSLHDTHAGLGARFVDFGGWKMPVRYSSVLAEHRAVREGAGVFDVSHLGRLSVGGPGAGAALDAVMSRKASSLAPGRTRYTTMLNDAGGIVDDIVMWRWDTDEFWVMPNAANAPVVASAIAAGADVEVEDLRPTTALLAVQGPDAPRVIVHALGEAPPRFRTVATGGARMAGTGYTGENGGEICVPVTAADELFAALVEAGATPCGLGARDTLRLEAGLVLWGADIDETTTPLEAGLEKAVDWDHEFTGRRALEAQRDAGVERRLVGVVMEERGIPRSGHQVRSGGARGRVTSGNLSPVLDTGIALAYLSPPRPEDESAEVEIRGKWLKARLATPPFHR